MRKILIAADNHTPLNSTSQLFDGNYFEIIRARKGFEAVTKARMHLPDIMVSDVILPELSGYELVKQIKENPRTKHIPIILLTPSGEDKRMIEAYENGADDCIAKPLNPDLLLARVDNIIKSREQLRWIYDRSTAVNHDFGVKDPLLTHLEALLVNHFRFRDFTIPEIAKHMNMSTPKLEREIKKLTGMTPIQYINDFRLHKAKAMLQEGERSIFEISHILGFKSLSYFGKAYKDKFGLAPSKTNNL